MRRKSIFSVIGIVAIGTFLGVYGDNRKDGSGTPIPTKATFTDNRDGKNYKKVKIGDQMWMAENLNYDLPSDTTDVCYENNADNCAKYGRLYNWNAATTACPAGWHLPSSVEWKTLLGYLADGSYAAGTKLKSSAGWNYYRGTPIGTDNYGFSALAGGYGISQEYFVNDGYYASWWDATENNTDEAWTHYILINDMFVYKINNLKTLLLSVRCLQD